MVITGTDFAFEDGGVNVCRISDIDVLNLAITSPTQLDTVTPPAQVAPVPRPAGQRLANTGYQLPDVGSWGRR